MMRRFLTLVVAAVVLSAPAWAQDGLRGVLSQVNYGPQLWPTVAGADLDGNTLLDAAVLVGDWRTPLPGSTRVIELHFAGQKNRQLTFQSQERSLAIAALDVNHDGAPDIVVERALTGERVQVWLNDGRGGFRHVDARRFPAEPPPSPVHLDRDEPQHVPSVALILGGRAQFALAARNAAQHHIRPCNGRCVPNEFFPDFRVIAPNPSRAPPRAL